MKTVKYLILGGGPAGLSFANCLRQQGEDSYLLWEKEDEAGGLCRSETVDGAPLDTGGGHFLDVRRPKVNAFLFSFLPEDEWTRFTRDSQIELEQDTIHHPLEANIWEMNLDSQIDYLKSIARAGCNLGTPMPEKFVDWIYWKLGDRIAESYMIPYNRKLFADDLNDLGTYWLEKLPDVSFEDTLRSCLSRRAYGKQPGHAAFYYPKRYGYGEVWKRMAQALGGHIEYRKQALELDFDRRLVRTADGACCQAEVIVTTVPWHSFARLEGMPEDIRRLIPALRHTAVEVRYRPQRIDTSAHWIYYPQEDLPYHRILVRHNFCAGSRGCWTETRQERTALFPKEDNPRFLNEYAYPLNTIGKPAIMERLLAFAGSRGVYGLGRWGEHRHDNSDVTVEKAMKLAQRLLEERERADADR